MMADMSDVPTWQETLHVSNDDAVPLVVFLEPWAESYVIPPRTAIEIVAFGTDDGHLVIDKCDNQLVVWGWTGSSVHVLENGRELDSVLLSANEANEIARQRNRPPVMQYQGRSKSP